MPFLVLLAIAAGFVAYESSKASSAAPAATPTAPEPYDLEAGMPGPLVASILSALQISTDPNALNALATTVGLMYPHAALALRQRAWQLGGSVGPAPTLQPAGVPSSPLTAPGSAPVLQASDLDPTLPAGAAQSIVDAIEGVDDLSLLQTLANAYTSYPLATYYLQHQIWVLSGGTTPAPVPPTSGAPAAVVPASGSTGNPAPASS